MKGTWPIAGIIALSLTFAAPGRTQTQIIETELDDPIVIEIEPSEPIIIETEIVKTPLDRIELARRNNAIVTETRVKTSSAPAAVLRGLDKMSGDSVDLNVNAGDSVSYGALSIELAECRYPTNNPSGNAYVRLTITDSGAQGPSFEGWMIASSPALMALDHPRYDIWVIRCKSDERTPSVVAGESSPRPTMRP